MGLGFLWHTILSHLLVAQNKKSEAARVAAEEYEAEAASQAAGAPSAKEIERARMRAQLTPLGLVVRDIAADGNCLFRAVSDQLAAQLLRERSGAASPFAATPLPPDHLTLRRRATEHIRLHPVDFGPFLPYEPQDGFPEGEHPAPSAVRAAVDSYCARMARPGIWGGHPELRALATVLLTPIVVHEADAPPQTIMPMTDEDVRAGGRASGVGAGEGSLMLSYHRHYYALGEHYNSVVKGSS